MLGVCIPPGSSLARGCPQCARGELGIGLLWGITGARESVNLSSLISFLGISSPIKMEKEAIQRQAEHCNDRKMASKRVQELSTDLFFAVFVRVGAMVSSPEGSLGFPHECSVWGREGTHRDRP